MGTTLTATHEWHPIHLENGQRKSSDLHTSATSDYKHDIPLSRQREFVSRHHLRHPEPALTMNTQARSPIIRSMDFKVEVSQARR
jgi:hypothetical protein